MIYFKLLLGNLFFVFGIKAVSLPLQHPILTSAVSILSALSRSPQIKARTSFLIPKTGPWAFIVPCETLISLAYCPGSLYWPSEELVSGAPWGGSAGVGCQMAPPQLRGANKIGPKQTDPGRSVQNRHGDKFWVKSAQSSDGRCKWIYLDMPIR